MLNFSDARPQSDFDKRPDSSDEVSLDEIKQLLRDDVESLVDFLFAGQKQTSKSRGEIRFGARGSLQIHTRGPKRGSFTDHESGEGGSPLDLIAYAQRCTFPDAIEIARGFLGVDRGADVTRRSETELFRLQAEREWEAQRERQTKCERAGREYQRAVGMPVESPAYFGPLAKACLVYLGSRGLDGMDAAGGSIPSEDQRGVFVMFPARNAAGDVTGYQRVYVTRQGERKEGFPKLSVGVIDCAAFDVRPIGEEIRPGFVAICEGPEDALTLAKAGVHAYAALGVSNMARAPLPDGMKVLAFLDDDKAGTQAIETANKAVAELQGRGFDVDVIRTYGGCKDVNELLQRDGIDAVRALVRGEGVSHETLIKPAIYDVLQTVFDFDVADTDDIFDEESDKFEPYLYAMAKSAVNPNEIPHGAEDLTNAAKEKADDKIYRVACEVFRLGISRDKRPVVLQVTPGGGKTRAYIDQCAELVRTVALEDRELLEAIRPEEREILLGELDTKHVDVYVPTHDLQFEIAERLREAISEVSDPASYEIVVMQARDGRCLRDKKVSDRFIETETSMAANACERTETVMKRSDDPMDFNEYEVQETLKCPHYDQCGYMADIDAVRFSKKRIVFRIWTHAHITHTLSFGIPAAQIAVIDEDASGQFINESIHDVDLFSGAHLKSKRFNKNGKPYGDLTDGQRADYLANIDKLRAKVGDEKLKLTNDLIFIQRNHNGLTDECRNEVAIRLGQNGIMRAVRVAMTREEVEIMLKIDRMNMRRVFVSPTASDSEIIAAMPHTNKTTLEMIEFWETILSEWDSGHDDARQVSWKKKKKKKEEKEHQIAVSGKFYITRINKSQNPEAGDVTNGRLANCRGNLLLADATPNLEVMGQALGELNVVKAEFRQNAAVYLDATKSYSKSKLEGDPEALQDVADKIRRIIAAHGTNGVVLAPKAIRRELERLLPELTGESEGDSCFLHFSADRGIDRFKDADWIVVIGGQRPNPDAMIRLARALYMDDPEPIDPSIKKVAGQVQKRTPLGADLSLSESVQASGVTYPVFIDERLQGLSNGIYEAGLTQAIGRVRAARSETLKRIFVFAERLPAGMVADHVEVSERSRKKTDRVLKVFEKSSGVFIASPGWLHAVAPDEFGTVKAAEGWLARADLDQFPREVIDIFYYSARELRNSHKSAIYSGSAKIKVGSGYAKRAIVHVFAVNKEEALEKLSTGAAMADCAISEIEIADN
ncbi:MAG: toprim domain-containing protein [Parvibaculaceae bacterium]